MKQHARIWEESPNIAKWRRKQDINQQYIRVMSMRFSLSRGMELIHIRILVLMGQVQSLGYWGSGLRPSGFTLQVTSFRLAGGVIQVWINSSPSNHCISHFKAQLAQLFSNQHLMWICWIKGILCGYAIRSGRHPSVSQRPGRTCAGRPDGRWLPEGCLPDRIA